MSGSYFIFCIDKDNSIQETSLVDFFRNVTSNIDYVSLMQLGNLSQTLENSLSEIGVHIFCEEQIGKIEKTETNFCRITNNGVVMVNSPYTENYTLSNILRKVTR